MEVVSYDPSTGEFEWKLSAVGCSGPYLHGQKYLRLRIDGKLYLGHRLAWFFHYGEWPGHIDHIDRDKRNNAISNLRIVNRALQRANSTKASSSGLKGVVITAGITIDGKRHYLGCFPTVEAAHEAYCKKAREVWGDHFYDGK